MQSTRSPHGGMAWSLGVLSAQHLPGSDADNLPHSPKIFADGARWRVEIPSVEGPRAMAAVIDEAQKRGVPVARISQGSGIMLQTDDEIQEMLALGAQHNIEVCLFTGPRASWDIGKQSSSTSGLVVAGSLRGMDQIRFALEDIKRGCDLGLRSILIGDLGLLDVVAKAKETGALPKDLIIKTSIMLPCPNAATARLLEQLGATTLNLPTDLSLAQIAAIRAAVDIPLDIYIEGADDFAAPVRHYEIPDIVHVASPVYLKFTVRNAPPLYPSGGHIEAAVLATARERVRRAQIGLGILKRHG